MTEEEIYQSLKQLLVEQFEIDPAAVTPEAHLYDDLGIDSIDAVDMLVHLREMTGKRIPPEQFKNVRTVGDVVTTIRTL